MSPVSRLTTHDSEYTKYKTLMSSESPQPGSWTFVTNHTQVLLCIAGDPGVRLRDVAQQVGITERAAQRIVADLVDAGFLERRRVGRRNHYRLNRDRSMRHPAQHGQDVGALLDLLQLEPSETSE
jgi:DNA-binding MarR family transcriptional regulator